MDKTKVIIDTCAFMKKADIIEKNINNYDFIIPTIVLEELDNLKENKDSEISFEARCALKLIDKYEDKFKYVLNDICDALPKGYDVNKNDNKILSVCKKENAHIYSLDKSVNIKAKLLGISTVKFDENDDDYKGYKILEIDTNNDEDNNLLANLYQNPNINYFDLHINQYLIIRDKACPVYDEDFSQRIGYKTLDILRWGGKELVGLKTPPKRIITPLNDLQKCALDLLYNRDIPIKIIAGCYGSGKTIISTLTGLYMVEEKGYYNKLVLVRNNDMHDSGRDPGALPGTLDEKTNILFKTMTQHFPMGEAQVEEMKRTGKLETHITFFIKGLSINGYIIVDEAEDLTIKDIKAVGSRLEKDGCIVFCGDWKQANGKYKNSNGLLHLLNKTKDNPLVGACVLDLDVRSDASKVFAEL